MKITKAKLQKLQKLPLMEKLIKSIKRIQDWYEAFEGDVHVSFSGGRDSTVLLDLVRAIYPDVRGVFSNTGLEYPEIVKFVKATSNIVVVRPKKTFKQVLDTHGYPIISRKVAKQINVIRKNAPESANTRNLFLTGYNRKGKYLSQWKLPQKWRFLLDAPFKISDSCCDILKKEPLKRYEKQHKTAAFIGTMASDSWGREHGYLMRGCNDYNRKFSTPLSFWMQADIQQYVKLRSLQICSIYCGENAVQNTGCIFCLFGVHMEKEPNRFQRLRRTHPRLHSYCMDELGLQKVLEFLKCPSE
jgi:3'-phosphoadenosine 5'-phosphosulfate sulfotransferase (PAPS reductase)/FAD synthetase